MALSLLRISLLFLGKFAGFSNIVECKSGISNDKNFLGIDSNGKVIGQDFNLPETLVVEASKA